MLFVRFHSSTPQDRKRDAQDAKRCRAIVKAAWKGHKAALEWLLLDPAGPSLLWQLRACARVPPP